MQYSDRQKAICENIVTIHETGRVNNKSYGVVTNVRGDLGGLTYGKHQVTINSGNLYLMLVKYCNNPGARFAQQIGGFLPAIRAKTAQVVNSPALADALRAAGNDPVMIAVQDQYFDQQYWLPAVKFCDARGLRSALALAVAYDSTIHGSLYRIDKKLPPGLDDKSWILTYVEARRTWLTTHTNALLRRTTYRMDTFRRLYDAGNFDLHSPVMAHGNRADINLPGDAASAPETNNTPVPQGAITQRIVDLRDRGDDVADLQQMLVSIGYNQVTVDGMFGPATHAAVIAFQRLYNLTPDGIVGPSTWRVLDQVAD